MHTAVLVDDVVVGEADDAHVADGEGVPKSTSHVRLPRRRRQREVGLVGLIADRSVAELVLVVAGCRHPGAVAGAAAVVFPKIPPSAHPVLGDVGVAEIAVEQVEQGPQPLDAERRIARRRRAEVVIDKYRVRKRHACGWHKLPAERRRALITEARERERRPAPRRSPERAELGLGAIVQSPIEVSGIGFEAPELGMMREDNLARFGVGVARRPGFDSLFELAIEMAEQDARLANGLQRVPGHHHVRGCIRAELQV
jgi:hypothetical protein